MDQIQTCCFPLGKTLRAINIAQLYIPVCVRREADVETGVVASSPFLVDTQRSTQLKEVVEKETRVDHFSEKSISRSKARSVQRHLPWLFYESPLVWLSFRA